MTAFSALATIPARAILDGSIRGHYAHLATMTIGEVRLDPATVVPMHAHPHEQVTYVIEGEFDFRVGDETVRLGAGMAALIPGGAMHGGKTITACATVAARGYPGQLSRSRRTSTSCPT